MAIAMIAAYLNLKHEQETKNVIRMKMNFTVLPILYLLLSFISTWMVGNVEAPPNANIMLPKAAK